MARKTCENGQSLDHFGLCTPCEWDCRLGNNPTSDIYYEDYMPSRAFECACYCNDVMTTQEKISRGHGSQQDRESSRACASTYVVDDEMEQTITVLQSINIKTEHYITVEVGSRQGVWALKAAQLAKRSKSYMSVYGHSIELMDMWKGRQREKLKLNKLEDEVVLASDIITENNYPALIKNLTMRTGKWQPINHIDWDCQGCEKLLASEEAFKLYEDNVLHMFIAVHSNKNHENLSKTYSRDTLINRHGLFYKPANCDAENSAALYARRGFIDDIHEEKDKCHTESPFGPIYYRDGTIQVFNKILFEKMNLTLRIPHCPPWKVEQSESVEERIH